MRRVGVSHILASLGRSAKIIVSVHGCYYYTEMPPVFQVYQAIIDARVMPAPLCVNTRIQPGFALPLPPTPASDA